MRKALTRSSGWQIPIQGPPIPSRRERIEHLPYLIHTAGSQRPAIRQSRDGGDHRFASNRAQRRFSCVIRSSDENTVSTVSMINRSVSWTPIKPMNDRLLDDPQSIGVTTLTFAMRACSMYCMKDVQTAIANVVSKAGKPKTLDVAIRRLALCDEFPSYFKDDVILTVFVCICRWVDHPTAKQLEPLQNRLDLIAHIMSGRVIFFTRTPLGPNVKEQWMEDKSGKLDGKKSEVLVAIRRPPEST